MSEMWKEGGKKLLTRAEHQELTDTIAETLEEINEKTLAKLDALEKTVLIITVVLSILGVVISVQAISHLIYLFL